MPLFTAMKTYAATQPNKPAVVMDGVGLSYGELWDLARRLDGFIHAQPRRARDYPDLADVALFAVVTGNRPCVLPLLLTALAGHSCVVLMDDSWPDARLREMLDRLKPNITFSSRQIDGLDGPQQTVRDLEDIQRLVAGHEATPAAPPSPSTPFMVGFTSGTTSLPKAFARNRASWAGSLLRGQTHFGIDAKCSTLAPGPLSHGLSLYALAETLYAGATFYAVGRFEAQTCRRLLGQENIQRLVAVPTVLESLSAGKPLKTLGKITSAGARLERATLDKLGTVFPKALVTEYYGASELGFVSCLTHSATAPQAGVGRAFPDVEIEIHAPDPQGHGQIWVKGDLAISDYLWRNDQSGLQREGDWASVGDIGWLDDQDNLHILSRSGGMIISGGNNIFPDEVASVLCNQASVARAFCLGLPDPYLGQKLVAVIETNTAEMTLNSLRLSCADDLARYKFPKAVYVTQEWPMTHSGKISGRVLAQWITEGSSNLVTL